MTKEERQNRPKWRDCTPEHDIHYGGYLSYRHLRMIGWLFMVLSQCAVIISLNIKVNPASEQGLQFWEQFFAFFGHFPVVLFMLANFAYINLQKGSWKRLFTIYGAIAGGLYALANILVFHFGFGFLTSFGYEGSFQDLCMAFGTILAAGGQQAYFLNMFIDLFMICLLFFFLDYKPKSKAFEGKKVILFRLLTLLPVAYEIASVIIKYHITLFHFTIPSYVFFLLPSKPPFIFLAFAVIAIALHLAKRRYIVKFDHTPEQWTEYKKTKAHSLKVSIMISVVFAITGFVDLLLLLGIFIGVAVANQGLPEIEFEIKLRESLYSMFESGLGASVALWFIIPLVILFSYRKQHKNPELDPFIPVAGIALIGLVYIEGIFQVITQNVAPVIDRLKKWIQSVLEEEQSGEQAIEAIAASARSLLDGIRFH